MGGAIGGVLFTGGSILSTAASLLGKDRAEDDYYKSLASAAQAQAEQTEENARRNAQYIFDQGGYQNSQLIRDYSSLLGQQKTALAASGMGASSATAQMILKNSRLNALIDQEMLNDNIDRAVYENDAAAFLQASQQREQARQYRRANRLRPTLWSQLGATLGGMFNNRGEY